MIGTEPLNPDYAVPPGQTILAALRTKGMSLQDLQQRTGLSAREANSLLAGQHPIDAVIAESLAQSIGGSKGFWLRRDALYRDRVQITNSEQPATTHVQSMLDLLPLRDMRKLGWLAPFAAKDAKEAALKFFAALGGDGQLRGDRLSQAVAFRTSGAFEANAASVAAWLHQGAIQATNLGCPAFQREALQDAIAQMRSLTRVKDPTVFLPQIVNTARECGVAVVAVRTPTGCHASGATHFLNNGSAVVQLSFRYRSDDHFWFTFFHEIGHLILHSTNPLFIEGSSSLNHSDEDEANAFSANTLVPAEHAHELGALGLNHRSIMRFAKRIGVSPGVVVGQMQHRGVLRHDQMNFLKVRYDWRSIEPATP